MNRDALFWYSTKLVADNKNPSGVCLQSLNHEGVVTFSENSIMQRNGEAVGGYVGVSRIKMHNKKFCKYVRIFELRNLLISYVSVCGTVLFCRSI